MKKLLSIVLAMAMVLALGVTAFAADEQTWTGTETMSDITVGAAYEEGTSSAPAIVYYVNITWEQTSTAKYTANAASYEWKTDTLQYVKTDGTGGTWSGSSVVKITVTNKSNADVIASVSSEVVVGITATNTWDKDTATIKTCAPTDYTDTAAKTATPEVFTLTVTPSAGEITSESTTIADITITLFK